MTTNDFVRRCLGLCGDKVDEILDKFDLEIDEIDVTRALSVCYPRFDEFGNYLISDLYQRVIDEAVESLGFDERKFDYQRNRSRILLSLRITRFTSFRHIKI